MNTSAPTPTYQILYADAPFLVRNQNAHIFVNLQMYVGDFLLSTQFSAATGPGGADVLTYTIQQSGQTTTATTLIPESIAVVPAAKSIQIVLNDSNGKPLIPLSQCPVVFYGYQTINNAPGQLYEINYMATPYYNSPGSAYVIVNMPINSTDQIIHSFTPGSDISSDTDMLTLNVANSGTTTPQTYFAKLGPFSPVAKKVAVQVCVNGQPKGGPKVIKSYGYDPI